VRQQVDQTAEMRLENVKCEDRKTMVTESVSE